MELFILTIYWGLLSNIPLFFFLILGAIVGRKMMLFFSLGVLAQVFITYGTIVGMVQDPARYLTTENVFSIICSIALSVGFYFLIKRKKKN